MKDSIEDSSGKKGTADLQEVSDKTAKDYVKYIKYTEMLYVFFLFCIQNEAGGCIHFMQSCGWNRKSAICNKEGC